MQDGLSGVKLLLAAADAPGSEEKLTGGELAGC
jgi:hypothetical protein